MKALVLDAEARTANLKYISKPSPGPEEILVEVKAISLNPIDPLYVAHPLGSSGRVVGSDFAGIVCEVGVNVPNDSDLSRGSRVAGFLQGACSVNPRPGAFAEYLAVPRDLVWKVPEGVRLEDAAGVSLVALTAAQGVWYRLGMPAPFLHSKTSPKPTKLDTETDLNDTAALGVFVYGASTSVGLYAAQMARLSASVSGRPIKLLGAASKARWPMLRSAPYNYDHLVDYHDSDWPAQILDAIEGDGVHFAYDGISEGDSVARVVSLLGSSGRMAVVRSREGGAWSASDLPTEPIYGAVWEGLGEEVQYQGLTVAKSSAARQFAVDFYRWLGHAIGSELLPAPTRVMLGGLERVVEDGFALLGSGSMENRSAERHEEWMRPVSAEKLVYRV